MPVPLKTLVWTRVLHLGQCAHALSMNAAGMIDLSIDYKEDPPLAAFLAEEEQEWMRGFGGRGGGARLVDGCPSTRHIFRLPLSSPRPIVRCGTSLVASTYRPSCLPLQDAVSAFLSKRLHRLTPTSTAPRRGCCGHFDELALSGMAYRFSIHSYPWMAFFSPCRMSVGL